MSSEGLSGAKNENHYAEYLDDKQISGHMLSDLSQKVVNSNNPATLSQQNTIQQNQYLSQVPSIAALANGTEDH